MARSDTIAIEHVGLIAMTSNGVAPDRTVVIQDGRIVGICRSRERCAPPTATRIDGRRRFLLPGLADMHVHVDSRAFHAPDASAAELALADRTMRQKLILYVLNGVTTIRDCWGTSASLEARERIARGQQIGPRLFASSLAMDGDPPIHFDTWGADYPGAARFGIATAAQDYVRDSVRQGYDFIKVYSALTPPVYDAIVSAAHQAEIPFAGHVPILVPLQHALESGQRSIEHLTGYDVACMPDGSSLTPTEWYIATGLAFCTAEKIAALARLTATYPVWNTPTLVVFEGPLTDYERSVRDRSSDRFVPPEMRDDPFLYETLSAVQRAAIKGTRPVRLALVKALSDAGAPLLLGTDTDAAGYAAHQELKLLVEAGLSPYQALVAATTEPARYLGRQGEFGTIVVGSSADMLLLDANPLLNIENVDRIDGVMLRGDWWSRARLDAQWAAVQRDFATQTPGS